MQYALDSIHVKGHWYGAYLPQWLELFIQSTTENQVLGVLRLTHFISSTVWFPTEFFLLSAVHLCETSSVQQLSKRTPEEQFAAMAEAIVTMGQKVNQFYKDVQYRCVRLRSLVAHDAH